MGKNIEESEETIQIQWVRLNSLNISGNSQGHSNDDIDLILEDLKSIYKLMQKINQYNSELCTQIWNK